jgi:hypothetical protein
VGALLDRVRVEGASAALVEEIRGLGLGYGIVTPYTTFVIQGQAEGAASAANMDLYSLAELNQTTGQVTIQARVQNQMYQQVSQADLAVGANVLNSGNRSLAQVGTQQVDLSLLKGQDDLDGPITDEWIATHLKVDRTIQFGSEEYFALAADPDARLFLQSGPNVVFAHQGEVIVVRDPDLERPERHSSISSEAPAVRQEPGDRGSGMLGATLQVAAHLIDQLAALAILAGLVLLVGLAALVALVCYAARPQVR